MTPRPTTPTKGPKALVRRLQRIEPGQDVEFHAMTYGRQSGWEWIEAMDALPGCKAVPAWGRDGWDCGSWPLVVYSHARTESAFLLLEYVEGDVRVRGYETKEELHEATDEAVHWGWRHGQGGPSDLPEGELGDEYRGPYKRERAKAGGA